MKRIIVCKKCGKRREYHAKDKCIICYSKTNTANQKRRMIKKIWKEFDEKKPKPYLFNRIFTADGCNPRNAYVIRRIRTYKRICILYKIKRKDICKVQIMEIGKGEKWFEFSRQELAERFMGKMKSLRWRNV